MDMKTFRADNMNQMDGFWSNLLTKSCFSSDHVLSKLANSKNFVSQNDHFWSKAVSLMTQVQGGVKQVSKNEIASALLKERLGQLKSDTVAFKFLQLLETKRLESNLTAEDQMFCTVLEGLVTRWDSFKTSQMTESLQGKPIKFWASKSSVSHFGVFATVSSWISGANQSVNEVRGLRDDFGRLKDNITGVVTGKDGAKTDESSSSDKKELVQVNQAHNGFFSSVTSWVSSGNRAVTDANRLNNGIGRLTGGGSTQKGEIKNEHLSVNQTPKAHYGLFSYVTSWVSSANTTVNDANRLKDGIGRLTGGGSTQKGEIQTEHLSVNQTSKTHYGLFSYVTSWVSSANTTVNDANRLKDGIGRLTGSRKGETSINNLLKTESNLVNLPMTSKVLSMMCSGEIVPLNINKMTQKEQQALYSNTNRELIDFAEKNWLLN